MTLTFGWRTYATAGSAAFIAFVTAMHWSWLTVEQAQLIVTGLLGLAGVFMRLAIARSAKVAATTLALNTKTISVVDARAVSVANPPPTPVTDVAASETTSK